MDRGLAAVRSIETVIMLWPLRSTQDPATATAGTVMTAVLTGSSAAPVPTHGGHDR